MKKEFKNVDEIINDSDFKKNVELVLSELIKKRVNRPNPKQGLRYKKDWYNRMSDAGLLNDIVFIRNIKSIWKKKSSLNYEYRNIIDLVCKNALLKTLSLNKAE